LKETVLGKDWPNHRKLFPSTHFNFVILPFSSSSLMSEYGFSAVTGRMVRFGDRTDYHLLKLDLGVL